MAYLSSPAPSAHVQDYRSGFSAGSPPGRAIRSFSGWAAILFALLPSSPLLGQAGAADSTRADTIKPVALPPMEVRILRTPLSRGESPLSVSTLGMSDLTEGRSGSFLEEAIQALPGVQIHNRFNYSTGERIVLRGMGARTQFGVRGIRVLLDEVPATLPDGQSNLDHVDLLSLAGVEVLRGPGASLYGNGAGGVIRFKTLPPTLAPLESAAVLITGSHGLHRGSLRVGGTLGDTQYILNLGGLFFGSFRGNPLRGDGTYGKVRRWNGSGRVIRPLAGGRLALTLNLLLQTSENPGSLSRDLMEEDPLQANAFNVRQGAGEDVSNGIFGVSWEREWTDLELDLGAHGNVRDLWNPIPPAVIDLFRVAGGLRGELRGIRRLEASGSSGISIRWTLGGDVDGQWDQRQNMENEGGQPGALTLEQSEHVIAGGGFGQARLEIGERAGLLMGLRYDRIRFEARDHLVSIEDPDDSGSRTMDAWSPSVGLTLSPLERLRLRGSISTFFQTPTTTELANQPTGAGGFNPTLEPQKGRNLEGGLSVDVGPGLELEAVLFRTLLSDELLPFEIPEAPGRVYFRNAGKSKYEGVETALFAALPMGLTFRGAYTYIGAHFQEFFADGIDLGGNRIPGLAAHRLEGVARWSGSFPWGSHQAFLELRGLYQGETPVDDGNSDAAGSFGLVDLRWGWEEIPLVGTRISVFGGINNLLDRRYVASVSVNAFGGRYFEPGPGRTFHIGVRARLFPPGDGGGTLNP